MTEVEAGQRTEEEAAEAILALVKAAGAELRDARQELKEKDTPFRRRGYVRAVFAAIAGAVEAMRQVARLHPEEFTESELILLRETRPDLDDRGNVVARKNKVPTTADLLFAFKSCMKAFGSELKLEAGDEWANFRRGVGIRDRITHPKSAEDFDLSDDDVDCVAEIADWLTERTLKGVTEKLPPAILCGIMIGLFILALSPLHPPGTTSD
jgi:hypothetical protein